MQQESISIGTIYRHEWRDTSGKIHRSPFYWWRGYVDGKQVREKTPVAVKDPNARKLVEQYIATKRATAISSAQGWNHHSTRPFANVAENYFTDVIEKTGKESNRQKQRALLNYIKKDFQNVVMGDITIEFVNNWLKNGTVTTRNRALTMLKAIMQHAVDVQRVIAVNEIRNVAPITENIKPTDSAKRRKKGNKVYRDIIVDEVMTTHIAEAMNPIDATILHFIYLGAFRMSEPLYLRWEDIKPATANMPRHIFLAGQKSKTGTERIVPITKPMQRILDGIHHRTGFIFSEDEGKTGITPNNFSHRFQKARTRARKEYKSIEEFSIRDLRRSRATHLLNDGVNIVYISRLLGHTNIQMTCEYLKADDKSIMELHKMMEVSDRKR